MAKAYKDLSGQRFGRLVAVQRFPNYKTTHTYYLCICDCGNEKHIAESSLVSGCSTSCGCAVRDKGLDKYRNYIGEHINSFTILDVIKTKRLYFKCMCDCGNNIDVQVLRVLSGKTKSCDKCREHIQPKRRKDIVGNKYGMLTVIEMLYNYNGKRTYCRCLCDCGNETIVHAENVKRGLSKSCGCLEQSSRFGRKHAVDIVGKRFGKLLVLKDSCARSANGSVIWECLCECGKTINASQGDLRWISSCGCEYEYGDSLDLVGRKFGALVVEEKVESGYKSVAWWKCRCFCGNTTIVNSRELVEGRRSSCGCGVKSAFEELVADVLDDNFIEYKRQQTFDGCIYKGKLRFDFYLEKYNLLIEADGHQHHKPVPKFGGEDGYRDVVKRDSIKNQYCKLNNINLLRIDYTLNKQHIQQQIHNYIDPVTITG